jgi:hypothetical protein
MSYAKSLKLSPFKTITLTIGKLPDGSIWQNAFITQEGAETSLSVDCPAHATKAERKDFLPLVKEALKRAQSIEELTSLLKPPAPLVEPILPEEAGWTAEQEMAAHETTLKGKLLNLMGVGERHTAAIEAVLNSGLLPEPQLQQWLNRMVERAIRRSLGKSGCPEWETWASKWLSGEDRTAQTAWAAWAAAARTAVSWAAARAAAQAAAGAAAEAAAEAAAGAGEAAWAAAEAAAEAGEAAGAAHAAEAAALEAAAWASERKAQYDDLFSLINKL